MLAIKNGIIVSRRGELTLGWELSLPAAYSLSEQDYDSLILCYYEAVRRLPPWTVLHRQDVYLRDEWHPDGAPRWSRSFWSRPSLVRSAHTELSSLRKKRPFSKPSSTFFLPSR